MPFEKFPTELMKHLFKEAIHEWLDTQFATFGRWTTGGLAAAILAGAIYLALVGVGWRR